MTNGNRNRNRCFLFRLCAVVRSHGLEGREEMKRRVVRRVYPFTACMVHLTLPTTGKSVYASFNSLENADAFVQEMHVLRVLCTTMPDSTEGMLAPTAVRK